MLNEILVPSPGELSFLPSLCDLWSGFNSNNYSGNGNSNIILLKAALSTHLCQNEFAGNIPPIRILYVKVEDETLERQFASKSNTITEASPVIYLCIWG